MHSNWTQLLGEMSVGTPGSGVSPEVLGRVLTRVARANGPVPRSEIGKGTMMPRPYLALASGTVGKAVDALTRTGLLKEHESRPGQVGPPIRPLSLDSPRWATVGIAVDQQHGGPDRLTGVICRLDGQLLTGPEALHIPREEEDVHSQRGLAEGIRKLTETLLAQVVHRVDTEVPPELLGVGVELGGHVHHGKVINSTHAQWSQPVDLGQALTKELGHIPGLTGVPVIVENDVNALAIHRYYARTFEGSEMMLVTVFPQGVGGAMIIGGRLYRGSNGMAPEPGHLTIDYTRQADAGRWAHAQNGAHWLTFDDECMCSTTGHPKFGHVDTVATPSRIEGQLASLPERKPVSLAQAARAPRAIRSGEQGDLVVSEESKVLHRAGRGLGRGLAHIINIVNPGQLILLLPEPLAVPEPQSSGTEYVEAAELAMDDAYSTGPTDARGGEDRIRLTVESYNEETIAKDCAVAAATTVFNAFIEHARGIDGCPPPEGVRRSRIESSGRVQITQASTAGQA